MSDSHSSPAASAGAILWSDAAREAAFGTWLQAVSTLHPLAPHTVRLASADASFRRYFRVDGTDTAQSFIVMDAPPALENSEPFVRVAALLQEAGLNVPRVLAWDAAQGFMLLTDLGSHTMLEVIDRDNANANQQMYLQAVDTLIDLQAASRPDVLPPYDEALLRRELALFPEWYVGRHRGVALDASQQKTLDDAFSSIVRNNLATPSVYVHRDFMPRNLMVTGARDEAGQARLQLGVLDFQDAVYGPVTYDIASLMRDAFLSWDEPFVLDITVRYWEKARAAGIVGAKSASGWGDDFGEFYRGVEWMGLQRHLKVAGIFARITLRDGKPRYLADTPRFIAYIRATADRYRELGPFLRVIDQIEGIQTQEGYAFGRV